MFNFSPPRGSSNDQKHRRPAGLGSAATLVLAVTALLSTPVLAEQLYTLQDVASLGVIDNTPYGINASGEVTGDSNYQAFLYTGGSTISFGGPDSSGRAINDSGTVAGTIEVGSCPGNCAPHAAEFENGVVKNLGTLGGASSEGYAINAGGEITGDSTTATGAYHAFLYDATGMHDLGGGPGGDYSFGLGVNASGEVVGTGGSNTTPHAILYANGAWTDLGTLGGPTSSANAINTSGQVVGGADTTSGATHAFLYSSGTMQDLGTLGGPLSNALAITDNGEVVGYSITSNDSEDAFLYDAGTMYDLNSLIAPTDPLYGSVDLIEATGINDSGQIIAIGDVSCDIGPEHFCQDAFLLNPVQQGVSLIDFPGGVPGAPTVIPGNSQVSQITAPIGSNGDADFYEFYWPGGTLDATASVSGSTLTQYDFELLGAPPSGSLIDSILLDSTNGFTGTMNDNISEGDYVIGVEDDPGPAQLTLTFNTPIDPLPASVPEPTAISLLLTALAGFGLSKRRMG